VREGLRGASNLRCSPDSSTARRTCTHIRQG
jgi:hypothetical protein